MSDLHSELEAWAKSAYTRDLFCGATSLSETLRAASARIAALTAERDRLAAALEKADALALRFDLALRELDECCLDATGENYNCPYHNAAAHAYRESRKATT